MVLLEFHKGRRKYILREYFSIECNDKIAYKYCRLFFIYAIILD